MKSKISVSVDSRIVDAVDSRIDGVYVKNRSQAVEIVLRELLRGAIKNAVILAGGEMSMAVARNVRRQVAMLRSAGVAGVLIAAGRNQASLSREIGPDARVSYLPEKGRLGTAGALRLAAGKVSGQFLLLYSDVEMEPDIAKMAEFHARGGATATAAVVAVNRDDSKENLLVEGEKVESFEYGTKSSSNMVLAGACVLDSRIFSILPKAGSLEKEVFPEMAKRGEITAYNISGSWRHLHDKRF